MTRVDEDKVEGNNSSIFVKNLPQSYDHHDLYNLLSSYGDIFSCKVSKKYEQKESDIIDWTSNKYGYVTFEEEKSAQQCINEFISEQNQGIIVQKYSKTGTQNSNNLFVRGFPSFYTEKDLEELFSEFGKVTSVFIKPDR